MAEHVSLAEITDGMDVLGSDGEKMASVDRVEGDYVVASKGLFRKTDYYIPVDAIERVDGDRIRLTMTSEVALEQGWDSRPESMTREATSVDDASGMQSWASPPIGSTLGAELQSGVEPEGKMLEPVPFEHFTDRELPHEHNADTISLKLSEEQLDVTINEVDRGAVRIATNVIENQQVLEVPVVEERVNVTRHPVARDLAPEEAVFESGVINVHVSGQDVDIQKNARVTEEIEIAKESVTDNQVVTESLRREEIHVTGDGNTLSGSAKVGDLGNSRRRSRNKKKKRS